MKLSLPVAITAALLVVACSDTNAPAPTAQPDPMPTAEPPAEPIQAVESESEKLAMLFDEHFEENLKMNPIQATFLGDPRYNDQLPNFLAANYRDEIAAMDRRYLAMAEAIDASALTQQERLSLEMFIQNRKDAIEGERFPGHLIPINQFFNITNFFAQLGSGRSAQPFNNVEDYENWLKRAAAFEVLIDQAIANMQEGVETGVVQPRVLMEKVVPQLEAHIVDTTAESLFAGPINSFPEGISEDEQARLTAAYEQAISETIVPTYRKLRDYLVNDYLDNARETVGMYALPDGEAWYASNVRQTTTTDLTPEQIHQIGLDEVDRIHEEMRGVMREVGFEGSLTDFFTFTKEDPQFYFETREDLVQAYRDFRSTVDALTPNLFSVFPQADYEVRPVEEFREQSASAASYQRAAPDGSRPGIFYVNAYDLSARPKWAVESLFLHEAAPGHHFQISIQQELEGLPKFRTFGGYTAYIEGWGLYSESLGKELGVYTDPYQYFGALAAELWRAIRLVVDTGIHAKGWTRAQVLEYMYANAPVAEARAVSGSRAVHGNSFAGTRLQDRSVEDQRVAQQGRGRVGRSIRRQGLSLGGAALRRVAA